MTRKTIILLITIGIFFTGCSEKQNPYASSQDILHEQSLMQTKKGTLLNEDNKIVAYVVGTYLNQVENSLIKEEHENTEVFLVGLYESEKSSSKLLKNIEFQIAGKEVGCYSPLDKDNKLLELIPSGNPWMQYYLLYAPNVQSRNITLTISAGKEKQTTLSFSKDNL